MRPTTTLARIVTAAAALGGAVAAAAVAGWIPRDASAVELPPVTERMRGFVAAPPLPASAIPTELRQAEAHLPTSRNGDTIRGQERLLLSGVGKNGVDVYAFPTTGGHVCVFVAERTHVATCVDSFDRRFGNVAPMIYSGETARQTVVGLAADEAVRVYVEAAGEAHQATLRRNAFFWQSPTRSMSRDDIDALLVEQRDGSVIRINLDF
jgi:hypothetical protein